MSRGPSAADRAARCQGKAGYISWPLANASRRALLRARRRRQKEVPALNIYRCRYCAVFHIGSAG